MLIDTHKRSYARMVWVLVLGLFLGGILTKLCETFLPASAEPARSFLTIAIAASLGPLAVDLVAVSFTLGPLTLHLNVLTLVGVFLVGLVAKYWI